MEVAVTDVIVTDQKNEGIEHSIPSEDRLQKQLIPPKCDITPPSTNDVSNIRYTQTERVRNASE